MGRHSILLKHTWDGLQKYCVQIEIPGYIEWVLKNYQHSKLKCSQHALHPEPPRNYEEDPQNPSHMIILYNKKETIKNNGFLERIL